MIGVSDAKKYGWMLLTVAAGALVLSRLVPGVGAMVGLRPMPLFPTLPYPFGLGGRRATAPASAPAAAPASDYKAMADSLLA